MTYDLQDYFTLSEEYEITNVTKRKSKTGQGKCLGSGEFRDIVPRQQSPTPPHFSTCLHLIAQVDKRWVEDLASTWLPRLTSCRWRMPSELVEEKRKARVRRSLFPKVLTLTHNDKK